MKITPSYKHLTQKSSFCGPASLQMILFRRGFWTEQEELAKKLNTKIKKKNKDRYMFNFEVDDSDAGVPLEKFAEIKELLKEYGLKAKILKTSEIKDLKELIQRNLEKGNDIILNIHRGYYDPKKNWGHFCLVNSIEGEEIKICDPSYEDKSYWKTSVEDLKQAMSDKIDGKQRGIVIISEV